MLGRLPQNALVLRDLTMGYLTGEGICFSDCAASSPGRRNTIQCIDSSVRPPENHLFRSAGSKLSQDSVPAGLARASDLVFVFNVRWD